MLDPLLCRPPPGANVTAQLQRNTDFIRLRDQRKVVVPVRTESNTSPMKQSASNRQPGQSHTRTAVAPGINHELAKAQYLADDLADHIFGHIVSTELARDILRQFVLHGIVEVFEHSAPRFALDPNSEDVEHAIDLAFEEADAHDCLRQGTKSDSGELEPSSADTKAKGKRANATTKGKEKDSTFSFKWSTFPAEPIDEDELVQFLNEITDHAFEFALPRLQNVVPKLKHRFATCSNKHHAMPLSYEPDGEDMRPDFVLLPVEAFKDNFKTVDPKYLNFTASRLVGEVKNKDLAAGVEQVQRYMRGLKRAQPWVHYVLALTVTRDKATLTRGEGSGTESLEVMLSDGRGCIEFIRILLGLALAEDIDLGQNPDVDLKSESRQYGVTVGAQASATSSVPSAETASPASGTANEEPVAASSSDAAVSRASLHDLPISSLNRRASAAFQGCALSPSNRGASVGSKVFRSSSRSRGAASGSKIPPSSSRTRNSALSAPAQPPVTTSSASSKRPHSDIGNGHQERRRKKPKTHEPQETQEERMIFFPLRVYGHSCLGILFTSSSIRGRGTTVFCVLDLSDPKQMLALKMSWQDLARVAECDAVMTRLEEKLQEREKEQLPHPNVVVPLKYVFLSFIGYGALTYHPQNVQRCEERSGV